MAKSNQKKDTKETKVQDSAIIQEETVQESTAMQEGQESTASQNPEVQDSAMETKPFTPYTAKVGVPLLVLRRVPDPNSKPIGTLHRGMKVEAVESRDGYAKLKNGTWVSEAHLERQQ
jgi:hypothetical protein